MRSTYGAGLHCMNQLDNPFVINEQQFDHLYYLVDGIYSALSGFLLTINDPTSTSIVFLLQNKKVGGKQWRETLVFGTRNCRSLLIRTHGWVFGDAHVAPCK